MADLVRAGMLAVTAVVLFVAPGPSPPRAMPALDDEAPVSLATVQELARSRAPAIAAARARIARAEGEAKGRTLLPDPGIVLRGGSGESRDGADRGSESAVEISQVVSPWGVKARKRLGAAAVDAATADVEAETARVVFEATTLYYEAAFAQARASALAEAAGDAQAMQGLVQRRVDVGEAASGDLVRTRVETLRAESEARAAEARAVGDRMSLNRFLLGALPDSFSLATDHDPRSLPPTDDEALARASRANPALRAARSRIAAAESSLSAERAVRFPAVAIGLFHVREIDKTSSGMSLGLSVPLWNRNKGAVGVAAAELSEAQSSTAALEAEVSSAVERLAGRDRAAREVAIEYRTEIVPAARESVDIARFSLEQGEATLLTWLEARRSYLEVLKASYDAEKDAFLTRAELERLMGDTHASTTE